MIQRPPRSTRSATLCPYTALFQPRLRSAAVGLHLDAVDGIGELHRVRDEKERDIVADEVPVAAVGIELDRKTAHIARGVDRPRAAGDGRKANEHRAARAFLLEDRRLGKARDRLGPFDHATRARSARLDDAVRHPPMVEREALRSATQWLEK